MEGLIDNPVEVVSEDAALFSLRSKRCVGDELHALARRDDSRTLFGRENISDDSQIGHDRVRVTFGLRGPFHQGNRIVRGREQNRRMEVGRFPRRTGGRFNHAEPFLDICRTGTEDGFVENTGSCLAHWSLTTAKVPHFLESNGLGAFPDARRVGVDRAGNTKNRVQDPQEFQILRRACAHRLANFLDGIREARHDIESANPSAERAQSGCFMTDTHLGE